MLGRIGHLLSLQLSQHNSVKSISKMPVVEISIPIRSSACLKKLKCITSSLHGSQFLAMRSFSYHIPPFRKAWGYNTFVAEQHEYSLTLHRMNGWVHHHSHRSLRSWGKLSLDISQSLEASRNEKFLTHTVLLKTSKLFDSGHLNSRMCSLWTAVRKLDNQCLYSVSDVEVGSKTHVFVENLKMSTASM